MTTAQRYRFVIDWFTRNMPVAETELNYTTPYELLVAVILSAQCTDKRVNLITPALFAAYRGYGHSLSRRDIRIHKKRIIPQQQSPPFGRNGSYVGRGVWRRSSIGH